MITLTNVNAKWFQKEFFVGRQAWGWGAKGIRLTLFARHFVGNYFQTGQLLVELLSHPRVSRYFPLTDTEFERVIRDGPACPVLTKPIEQLINSPVRTRKIFLEQVCPPTILRRACSA